MNAKVYIFILFLIDNCFQDTILKQVFQIISVGFLWFHHIFLLSYVKLGTKIQFEDSSVLIFIDNCFWNVWKYSPFLSSLGLTLNYKQTCFGQQNIYRKLAVTWCKHYTTKLIHYVLFSHYFIHFNCFDLPCQNFVKRVECNKVNTAMVVT